MKTRTLLLLSVACGLAILVAGTVMLVRLGGQTATVPALAVGESASVGDATVRVVDVAVGSDAVVVTVTWGGVDDPSALDDVRLVVPGHRLAPTADGPRACDGLMETESTCDLTFDTSGYTVAGPVLVLERAGEKVRWDLAP